MENWRKVWREGFAPIISDAGLNALREALIKDDPFLIQRRTTKKHYPQGDCRAACAIAYTGWQGDGIRQANKVIDYFELKCDEADKIIQQRYSHADFLNWFDNTMRDEMIRELLPEVEQELHRRRTLASVTDTDTVPVSTMYRVIGGEG